MRIPILQLDRILLVSIQVDLTDNDAMQFQSDLVERVAAIEALGVAIDITALDVVDSYMARVINDTANMVRLLGADCAFNLGQALEMLKGRIAKRGDTRFVGDEDV